MWCSDQLFTRARNNVNNNKRHISRPLSATQQRKFLLMYDVLVDRSSRWSGLPFWKPRRIYRPSTGNLVWEVRVVCMSDWDSGLCVTVFALLLWWDWAGPARSAPTSESESPPARSRGRATRRETCQRWRHPALCPPNACAQEVRAPASGPAAAEMDEPVHRVRADEVHDQDDTRADRRRVVVLVGNAQAGPFVLS